MTIIDVNPVGCRCPRACEFPCWQREGIADPCSSCGCVTVSELAAMPHEPDGNNALLAIEEAVS